ncbi:MAG: helix-turn-helix transcriptional regulator [Acidobacteriota bacterium]
MATLGTRDSLTSRRFSRSGKKEHLGRMDINDCPDREKTGRLGFDLAIIFLMGKTEEKAIQTTEELGQLIRAQRKATGLTQSELADASGVSLRFISELERGRASAGVGRVLRVLHMLGLSVQVQGVDVDD